MSIEGALTLWAAFFIFAITPGPGVIALLARSMTSGTRSCLGLAFGMTISDVVYLVLACLGLSTIAAHYQMVFTIIRFAGGCYLIYLGWQLWRAPASLDAPQVDSHQGHMASCLQGVMISATNPKVIIFYIAFLPTFLDMTALTAADIVLVACLAVTALMAGLMLVAAGGGSTRRLFRTGAGVRCLNRVAGSIMVAAGGYLAGNG